MRAWLLPEYIDDILPPEARKVESIRRKLLDLFQSHGYELIIPPLLEYLPSLLSGTGHDMDIKTFKLVDQLGGRMLGLRADITPQAARIDAHLLNRQGVVRLCYAGSVLHTIPAGHAQTREPLQIGAELFGHAGLESDVEVLQLMLKALRLIDVPAVYLDIGHVAVFRSLVTRQEAGLELESDLFQALQSKDVAALDELTAGFQPEIRAAVLVLPELYGGPEVLAQAKERLPAYPEIQMALAELTSLAGQLQGLVGSLCFDLAELRGYHYHSGAVFAAYTQDHSFAVAQGGRYDNVGQSFGRARPATGFSLDLRALAELAKLDDAPLGILAAYAPDDASLQDKIAALRGQNERVVVDLPGHESARSELECDRMLAFCSGSWEVISIEE